MGHKNNSLFQNNTQQYTTIHNNTQQYTMIHNNTQQYTTIDNNTQQYTTIHNNTQRYTTIHNNTQQQAGTELGQAQFKLELYYTLIFCRFGLIELTGWYINYFDSIN